MASIMKCNAAIYCVLALAATCAADSPAREALQQKLRSSMNGSVVTLRQFFQGRYLKFDSNGDPIDPPKTNTWTLDSKLKVSDVEVHERKIMIKGRRLAVIFEHGNAMQYRPTDQNLEIELSFGKNEVDAAQAENALKRVFLSGEDKLSGLVPDFWREFVATEIDHQAPLIHLPDGKGVRSMKELSALGPVKPPRVTKQPDPEYTEIARNARLQGIVLLQAEITEDGQLRNVEIRKALGLGLDEAAVEAVQKWRFQPAIWGGQPVAVKLNVEVNFRMR